MNTPEIVVLGGLGTMLAVVRYTVKGGGTVLTFVTGITACKFRIIVGYDTVTPFVTLGKLTSVTDSPGESVTSFICIERGVLL